MISSSALIPIGMFIGLSPLSAPACMRSNKGPPGALSNHASNGLYICEVLEKIVACDCSV